MARKLKNLKNGKCENVEKSTKNGLKFTKIDWKIGNKKNT